MADDRVFATNSILAKPFGTSYNLLATYNLLELYVPLEYDGGPLVELDAWMIDDKFTEEIIDNIYDRIIKYYTSESFPPGHDAYMEAYDLDPSKWSDPETLRELVMAELGLSNRVTGKSAAISTEEPARAGLLAVYATDRTFKHVIKSPLSDLRVRKLVTNVVVRHKIEELPFGQDQFVEGEKFYTSGYTYNTIGDVLWEKSTHKYTTDVHYKINLKTGLFCWMYIYKEHPCCLISAGQFTCKGQGSDEIGNFIEFDYDQIRYQPSPDQQPPYLLGLRF